jgi:flagellum-specific peptidoglycan hydrolase FlgJ
MNPQMRMLVLLAVFWVAGSLLLAAESPSTSTPKPAATAKKVEDAAKGDAAKTDATKADATKTDTKEASKDGTKESGSASGKPSIAEQAEAALKAAYDADPKEAAKADPDAQQHAKDDTQTPPDGNAPKGPSPQRFVPSEQVRADFDVSFPIDI